MCFRGNDTAFNRVIQLLTSLLLFLLFFHLHYLNGLFSLFRLWGDLRFVDLWTLSLRWRWLLMLPFLVLFLLLLLRLLLFDWFPFFRDQFSSSDIDYNLFDVSHTQWSQIVVCHHTEILDAEHESRFRNSIPVLVAEEFEEIANCARTIESFFETHSC